MVDDAPLALKKRVDWLESNVADLWQHVNEIEEERDDDTRSADWWETRGNSEDTDIEPE